MALIHTHYNSAINTNFHNLRWINRWAAWFSVLNYIRLALLISWAILKFLFFLDFHFRECIGWKQRVYSNFNCWERLAWFKGKWEILAFILKVPHKRFSSFGIFCTNVQHPMHQYATSHAPICNIPGTNMQHRMQQRMHQ